MKITQWLLRMLPQFDKQKSDLNAEIASHIRMAAEDRIARGEHPAQAYHAAAREFGNVPLVQDVTRHTWGSLWLERLGQDLKYAFRQLRKSPGYALTTIFVLALGIAANTTIFTFVNALLLRPPAIAGSSHLAEMMLRNEKASGIESYLPLNYPDYLYYRDHNHSLSGLLAFDGDPRPVSWSNSGEGRPAQGQIVSGNFFDVLGVKPLLGRAFLPEEDNVASAHPVVVLSHAFWQQQLSSDRKILGRTLIFDGTSYTVIGVAPASFTGIVIGMQPDFWAPISMAPLLLREPTRLTTRNASWLLAIGRIQPGFSRTQAQADLGVLSRALEQQNPKGPQNLTADLFPVHLVPQPYRIYVELFTGLLMAVVGMVLLIACANAANLLLARALTRRHELAVRSALGASRARLILQTLTESIFLSLVAGACGLLLSLWITPALLKLKPANIPIRLDVPLDIRVFCFTLALSVATGVVFGIAPALRSPRKDLVPALHDTAHLAGPRRAWLRDILVVAQITVCLVMLIGAGLCVRSLFNARSIDPGFDTRNVVLADVNPASLGYTEAQGRLFYQQLLDRMQAQHGVVSASLASYLPLGVERSTESIVVDGQTPPPGQQDMSVGSTLVRPGFLSTMGIPLLQGRDFSRNDPNAAGDVIINDAMARRFWPGRSALGRTFQVEKQTREVIGIVKTGKYGTLSEEPTPFMYQFLDYNPEATLVVRIHGDPQAALAAIRREVRSLDPNVVPMNLETMSEFMALPLFPAHTTGILLGAFGITALLLAVAGLYGVISYSVSQRTHEIGLRMALGANHGTVVRLIVRQGMRLTLIGIAAGLVLAFAATRVLSSLLYGIKPTDPATFAGISLLMVITTLLSCYIPARRAASIEPMEALRSE